MKDGIAIVGLACEYPDARSPAELWENVLARRQAFRRLPAERLRIEDYVSDDRSAPDRTYGTEAAVLADYSFDTLRFRVAAEAYRAADLAHWLALDVAARALDDAGFSRGEGLPRETTGVLVGNSLTGEFSRANSLRLRWPYVARVVAAALAAHEWPAARVPEFLEELEASYKAPFPPVGAETLAGGLSNTIAGRISNHFDLNGGGFTVDGACASSLLAVSQACSALTAGDLDMALAGGVDLSLDPFELVGFAKAGALANGTMRVFDAHSAGFWPGEGCGFAVLMRLADALKEDRRIVAVIRGWGISSDGQGGLTRPEADGQRLALRRAYHRAEYGIETVAYFEGHGTGTSVGDATELRALTQARREADDRAPPAAIGSIKANIGHTKAAAGIAGIIKAALALHHQILPPTTACDEPHPELRGERAALRVLAEGELFPSGVPLRAGVSAMGFGGINAHVTLEATPTERRTRLTPHEHEVLRSAQDVELLLLDADDRDELVRHVDRLLPILAGLSRSELGDLACELARAIRGRFVRAGLVAARPRDASDRLGMLRDHLIRSGPRRLDFARGVFLAEAVSPPRIGFLFPGQGVPEHRNGGALRRRFSAVGDLYKSVELPSTEAGSTAAAQPAIVTASLAGLRVLAELGIEADIAVGHSLGELTALHWAGAYGERVLLRLAIARGRAMADHAEPGAMASIAAGREDVEALLNGDAVTLASFNAPRQTVISGAEAAVNTIIARARARGLAATRLAVSLAFHSPRVAPAVPAFSESLEQEDLGHLQRVVASTVTGGYLGPEDDLRALLRRQVTSPVQFESAVRQVGPVDLWVEVGPGRVLAGLVDGPVAALDAGGPSLAGPLGAVGAAFALGLNVNLEPLFEHRFARPFEIDHRSRFLASPCEEAPRIELQTLPNPAPKPAGELAIAQPSERQETTVDLLRRLVAEKTEFPLPAVLEEHHLLHELHLNSITIGQIVAEAAQRLGIPAPVSLGRFVDGTIGDVSRGLEEHRQSGIQPAQDSLTSLRGVDSWIRTFTVELIEHDRPRRPKPQGGGEWEVMTPHDHPLGELLKRAFANSGAGGGVVVGLPRGCTNSSVGLLLEAARRFQPKPGRDRFIVVQDQGLGGGFARSLFLEMRGVGAACVLDVSFEDPRAADWAVAEALNAHGFVEVYYDRSSTRREPRLRLLPLLGPKQRPLGPDDVLVVSGGGKGIAFACARALAKHTGVRLALLGRARPSTDLELAGNLRTLEDAGLAMRYLPADVTDQEEVNSAVQTLERDLGPVTAILHAAGRNEPRRVESLTLEDVVATLAPKVRGARNLVEACREDRLRWFLAFGSMIARTGMAGEAHYALANEALTRFTVDLARQRPECRCLALEWSVWSELGMGERLGRVEALQREGIASISPDQGVDVLLDAMSRPVPGPAIVVTSRFGAPPTLALERPSRPLLRFVERPQVDVPGVELVVDADLSTESDPYLDDHVFGGERLFPAVLGLEAMAQVAMAATDSTKPPSFENIHFDRPVVAPPGRSTTIRIAALVRNPGRVEVALRCDSTGFQLDHFRATCLFGAAPARDVLSQELSDRITLDPGCGLYGEILFQSGRFQRLLGYRELMAQRCVAEIENDRPASWFGQYVPADLVLDDPGARDAALHAIQACIPHATILPVGVDRLQITGARSDRVERRQARAVERACDGETLTYDLEVRDAAGILCERWEGLRLRIVARQAPRASWAGTLIGPYAERRVRELLPFADLRVSAERGAASFGSALRRALKGGQWEAGGCVATAHRQDLTLAVASPRRVACALWPVERPTSGARDGFHDPIAPEAGEPADVAASRIGAATECLRKVGANAEALLVLNAPTSDGWIVLRSGDFDIATLALPAADGQRALVLGFLAERRRDAL